MKESISDWDVENTDPRLDRELLDPLSGLPVDPEQSSWSHWFQYIEKGRLILDVLFVCWIVFCFVNSSPFWLVIAIMAMISWAYLMYRRILNRQSRL